MYVGVDRMVQFPLLIAPKASYSVAEAELFVHDYDKTLNYGKVDNLVTNDEYATAPSHPTSKKVGSLYGDTGSLTDTNLAEMNDANQWKYVYADSIYTKKTLYEATEQTFAETPSTYTGKTEDYPEVSFIPATGLVKYEDGLAGSGHHWGYGTCEWIRHCYTAGQPNTNSQPEFAGSRCERGNPDGTVTKGFCFEADNGNLECGRMLETTDKYNVVTWQANTLQRCPRGAPATSVGSVVSKRLLVGGCMIPADANYTATAEVHVPQMCYLPKDFHKGCMFPGATNYDPAAVQPAACHYLTQGCTDSTAVNYNREAGIDDGSCIATVLGCTVKSGTTSYTDVATDTPAYQTRHYGSALRTVGKVILPAYAAVLNYNPSANVNVHCIVAVEGCMDPDAVNYHPLANVNSNTWCIPKVEGCMMPSFNQASLNFHGAGAKTHYKDGGSANYLASATVNTGCLIERYGCMDSLAYNYDAHATVPTTCYQNQGGCFDNAASNFNCTKWGVDNAGGAGFTFFTTPCTDAFPSATVHYESLCYYGTGDDIDRIQTTGSGTLKVAIVLEGQVEDFGSAPLTDFTAKMEETLELQGSGGFSTATGGSVTVTYTCENLDGGAYAKAAGHVASKLNSLSKISGALGVTALSLPTVTASNAGDDDSTGAIIGGVVGGLGGCIMIGGLLFWMKSRKSGKVEA